MCARLPSHKLTARVVCELGIVQCDTDINCEHLHNYAFAYTARVASCVRNFMHMFWMKFVADCISACVSAAFVSWLCDKKKSLELYHMTTLTTMYVLKVNLEV